MRALATEPLPMDIRGTLKKGFYMNTIYCRKHGHQHAVVACEHVALNDEPAYAPDSQSEGEPDAWCYDCHTLYEEEHGYTPVVEQHACITAVCPVCFQQQLSEQAPPIYDKKSWWQFW